MHTSAYVVQLGQFGWAQWFGIFDSSLAVNYRTFGSGHRKLARNTAPLNDERRLWRHSSMTSFIFSPFADARKRLRRPFLSVFGGIWPPKCVKIWWRVTSIGESRKKIKKKRPCIWRICSVAVLLPICTNVWLHVCLVDVINCAKYYCSRLMGLDSVRSQILTIPIGMWHCG